MWLFLLALACAQGDFLPSLQRFDLLKDGGAIFQILVTGSSIAEANIEKHLPFHGFVSFILRIIAGT